MPLCRRAFGWFGAAATLLATSLAQAQCSKDTDCKGERVCEAGSCVAVGPSAAAPPTKIAPDAPAAPPASARAAQPPIDTGTTSPGPAMDLTPPQPKMQRHSKGMMVGGIVMTSLAPVALVVAGFAALGKSLCGIDDFDPNRSCDGYDPAIYGSLISALVLVGVGVPMIVIGAKKEPVDPTSRGATISPWATPTAVGLGLRLQL